MLSFEGGGSDGRLRLATSGIGAAYLTVDGRASHAGAAPEAGLNALYELSHQMLQTARPVAARQGPEPELDGLAGRHQPQRNPRTGHRARRRAGAESIRFHRVEAALQERVKTNGCPEAKVQLSFEMRRPPLEATPASRRLAAHARRSTRNGVADEGADVATGGGTDAAFAALKTTAPVIEGFGLRATAPTRPTTNT